MKYRRQPKRVARSWSAALVFVFVLMLFVAIAVSLFLFNPVGKTAERTFPLATPTLPPRGTPVSAGMQQQGITPGQHWIIFLPLVRK